MSEYRPPGVTPPPVRDPWPSAATPIHRDPYDWATEARPAPAGGLMVASLICGIVGVVVGVIPLFFFVAWVLGLVAVVLGFVARHKRRAASRMTITLSPGHSYAKGDSIHLDRTADQTIGPVNLRVVSVTPTSAVVAQRARYGMALWGIWLGTAALVLGCVGLAVIQSAVNDLDHNLDQLDQQIDQDLGTTTIP
jgi:hypothetical protein